MKTAKQWEERCFRHGNRKDDPNAIYYVKLMHQGRRENFSTGTPIKARAGVVAREIFMSLRALGWEKTIAKYCASFAKPAGDHGRRFLR